MELNSDARDKNNATGVWRYKDVFDVVIFLSNIERHQKRMYVGTL